MRFRSFVSLCLTICLSLSVWSQSQAAPPTLAVGEQRLKGKQAAKAKNEVQKRGTGERSKVKVTLRDRTEVKGYISQIDADSFQVTDKESSRVTTIAYDDALKVRKNGLSTSAKIAIGAGAVGGAMIVLGLVAIPVGWRLSNT